MSNNTEPDDSEIKPKIFNRQLSWDGVIALTGIFGVLVPALLWGGIFYAKLNDKLDLHSDQIRLLMDTMAEVQKTQSETSQQMAVMLQRISDAQDRGSGQVYQTPRQSKNNLP